MSEKPSETDLGAPTEESKEELRIGQGLWLAGILMLLLGILLGIGSATKALLP